MPEHNWTEKQSQYLAFITSYSVIHGLPPVEGRDAPGGRAPLVAFGDGPGGGLES